MRARTILETLDFERGIDPKDSMNIGRVVQRKNKKILETLPKSWFIKNREIMEKVQMLANKLSKEFEIIEWIDFIPSIKAIMDFNKLPMNIGISQKKVSWVGYYEVKIMQFSTSHNLGAYESLAEALNAAEKYLLEETV